MAQSRRILDSVEEKFSAFVVDTVLDSNVFATMMFSKARPWAGDERIFPIKVSKHSNGKSFSGLDTFTIAQEETTQQLSYEPKFYAQPVTLSLTDVTTNNVSETQVFNLVGYEMESSAQDMADAIGTIFFGDGTGNSGSDFLGLEAIVDDGSAVANIGGLSRSTYTTLQSTVTASGGTLTLAKMRTLWDDITSGSVAPTMGLTTPAVFSLYDQLLEAKERVTRTTFTKNLRSGAGFTGLDFRGIPIVADEKCTAQTLFFLNEKFLMWEAFQTMGSDAFPELKLKPVQYRGVDIQGNDYSDAPNLGFHSSGFTRAQNALGMTNFIVVGGNLMTNNPKRHGKLTGITSV
jgi:hypothetical protein